MRLLRTMLFAVPLVCAAPGLASAQDFDTRIDESYRGDDSSRAEPRREPSWRGSEDVYGAARQISARATQLARAMRDLEGYSPLTDEARNFARTARIFERSVRSGAPYPEVLASFEILQREYYAVRTALFRAHRAHHAEGVTEVWTSLVSSFERLALSLGVEEDQLCALPDDARPYHSGRRYDSDDDLYGRYDPRFDR